jgi:serine/threonine-protein kinase
LQFWQRPKIALGVGALGVLLTAGASFLLLQPPAVPAPGVARASLTPPPSEPLEAIFNINVALTPDGTRMVYRGLFDGQSHLFVRSLDEFEATPLTGLSLDPRNPFISPDGTRVGFFDGNRSLQRVSILGGPPVTITDIPGGPRGASWGSDDTIVFATGNPESGLLRVGVGGGDVETLTVPDPEQGERDHLWPEILPGGESVLFTIRTNGPLENAQVAVLSLQTGEYDVLFPGGSSARYVPTGHIVYGVGGTLRAVGFDLGTLTVTTEPIPVIEEVLMGAGGEANFDIAQDGALVYVSGTTGGAAGLDLVWVDQEGNKELLPAEPGRYAAPRLSPDGSRMAIQVRDPDGNSDIFTYDISRNNFSQFTFHDSADCCPFWTPDGARVVWSSARNGQGNLYMKNADGTGEVERVGESDATEIGFTWSADGADLIFASGNGDLYTLSGDDQAVAPLFETEFSETRPRVSPDGRWIAYESNEDGTANVYVRPFPDVGGGKWKVSAQGGVHPLWSPDGRELFYSTGDSVLAVPITTDVTFDAGNPRLVFQGRYETTRPVFPLFDLAPDGTRFLMTQRTGTQSDDTFAPLNLVAVFNWFEELKDRVPVP